MIRTSSRVLAAADPNAALYNFVGGEWTAASAAEKIVVENPATGVPIAAVPDSNRDDVDACVAAALDAFSRWRKIPPVDRAQHLFRFKHLLEEEFEEIARIVTLEHGKTLAESRGEVRRAIENVDVAVGVPTMMQGRNLEDVARGIDEYAVRQPLGVFAAIAPFNFPAMVPFWFVPYAIATGNAFIVKPSEQTPLSQVFLAELADRAGLPGGVLSILHGGRRTSEALLEHPDVQGISFVGSTPVARSVYQSGTANGKRVQAQGGAKNYIVLMPDAEMEPSLDNILESAYGCAGQRCLAGSVVVAVGDAYEVARRRLTEKAEALVVGDGFEEETGMGPVISAKSRARILDYIDAGVREGAELLVDGRGQAVAGRDGGHFLGPTLMAGVNPDMVVANDEIFGPVLCLMPAGDLDEAIEVIDRVPFGNMACIFTGSGKAARQFSSEVRAGNIGVNIGVAAPMAFFHFGGMKDSFFGDLHAQAEDSIRFFTEDKIVVSRWF